MPEHFQLIAPVRQAFRAAVEADLAHIARPWEQLIEFSQLTSPLASELGMQPQRRPDAMMPQS